MEARACWAGNACAPRMRSSAPSRSSAASGGSSASGASARGGGGERRGTSAPGDAAGTSAPCAAAWEAGMTQGNHMSCMHAAASSAPSTSPISIQKIILHGINKIGDGSPHGRWAGVPEQARVSRWATEADAEAAQGAAWAVASAAAAAGAVGAAADPAADAAGAGQRVAVLPTTPAQQQTTHSPPQGKSLNSSGGHGKL